MINEAVVTKAIVDLKTQITFQYTVTAKKYKINYEILQKHFFNQTVSRMEIYFNSQKHLNLNKKKFLVDQINTLLFQKFFGIFAIVQNFISKFYFKIIGEY